VPSSHAARVCSFLNLPENSAWAARVPVAVFRYSPFTEQRAQHGHRPNFEELLQMWNQKYPHWAYDDYRALSKAYREAYREVVYPKYQMPGAAPLEA
jgi:hypothetical protein